ncbi:S1C family serine protease [Paenibacillus yanchengensis]|uniref:S1C family serine protease n=1 Tax=Paenibacillus yanchengensis TaxID=2035833 RepID=A0ABW4YIM1_9BACL
MKSGDSKGTGFNITANGLIITNEHVVDEAKQHLVSFANGKTYTAELIASVPELDTALLQLKSKEPITDLPTLPLDLQFNSMEEASLIAQSVYVVGNPLFFSHIANEGTLIGKTLTNSLESYALVIDAPIYKGNSGSPLINEQGKVIGVVFATTKMTINQKSKNVGLAIPIEQILNHEQFKPLLLR